MSAQWYTKNRSRLCSNHCEICADEMNVCQKNSNLWEHVKTSKSIYVIAVGVALCAPKSLPRGRKSLRAIFGQRAIFGVSQVQLRLSLSEIQQKLIITELIIKTGHCLYKKNIVIYRLVLTTQSRYLLQNFVRAHVI